jgi:hypothetical protein
VLAELDETTLLSGEHELSRLHAAAEIELTCSHKAPAVEGLMWIWQLACKNDNPAPTSDIAPCAASPAGAASQL